MKLAVEIFAETDPPLVAQGLDKSPIRRLTCNIGHQVDHRSSCWALEVAELSFPTFNSPDIRVKLQTGTLTAPHGQTSCPHR